MSAYRPGHSFAQKTRTSDVLTEEQVDFSSLLLSPALLQGLADTGFEKPSPIQLKAIPLGRCGLDLIAQAKSGTGKTCVFSVIALENVITENIYIQVLILAPTREIAVQVRDVINAIGQYIDGLGCSAFIGGLSVEDDKKALKTCQIAVGTPGRIKYLIENKLLKTDSVRMFILDEADKLLDESFQEQINWIFSSLPENKQMMAFSATYPEYLANHLKRYMREPTFVRLNAADPTLQGIKQFYSLVPFHPLPHKIFQEKVEKLINLLSSVNFNQCLVFSNYQIRAQSLSDTLCSKGWPATFIAGSQTQAKRLQAMEKLKKFQCRILISTDLTARGIDAENVNLVVNMDVPYNGETYLHRIGRAGRFGTRGVAVTYVAKGKEEKEFQDIQTNIDVPMEQLPENIPDVLLQSAPSEAKSRETPDIVHIGFIKNGKEENCKEKQHPNMNGDTLDQLSTNKKHVDSAIEYESTKKGDSTSPETLHAEESTKASCSRNVEESLSSESAEPLKTSTNSSKEYHNTSLPIGLLDDFADYHEFVGVENASGDNKSTLYSENHPFVKPANTTKHPKMDILPSELVDDFANYYETVDCLASFQTSDANASDVQRNECISNGNSASEGNGNGDYSLVAKTMYNQDAKECDSQKRDGNSGDFTTMPSAEEFQRDFDEYLEITSSLGLMAESTRKISDTGKVNSRNSNDVGYCNDESTSSSEDVSSDNTSSEDSDSQKEVLGLGEAKKVPLNNNCIWTRPRESRDQDIEGGTSEDLVRSPSESQSSEESCSSDEEEHFPIFMHKGKEEKVDEVKDEGAFCKPDQRSPEGVRDGDDESSSDGEECVQAYADKSKEINKGYSYNNGPIKGASNRTHSEIQEKEYSLRRGKGEEDKQPISATSSLQYDHWLTNTENYASVNQDHHHRAASSRRGYDPRDRYGEEYSESDRFNQLHDTSNYLGQDAWTNQEYLYDTTEFYRSYGYGQYQNYYDWGYPGWPTYHHGNDTYYSGSPPYYQDYRPCAHNHWSTRYNTRFCCCACHDLSESAWSSQRSREQEWSSVWYDAYNRLANLIQRFSMTT